MSGKKGMMPYSSSIKEKIRKEHSSGRPIRELSREYGISRYAIQSWCGLIKGKEVSKKNRQGKLQNMPIERQLKLELRIKELEREVELYKSFLHAAGRM